MEELMEETIVREIANLENLTPGSKEHTTAVNAVATLYKLKLQEDELQEKKDRRDMDAAIRESDEEFKKKDRLMEKIKLGVGVAEVILPLVFYGSWLKKGLKFEETGSITSTTFRNFVSKLKF